MKTIHVHEEHLPLAWERAVVRCWQEGRSFRTEYDRPGDPESRDVTAMIHVTNSRRPEIVLFGQGQELRNPLAVEAGNQIMVTGNSGSDTISVAKFSVDQPFAQGIEPQQLGLHFAHFARQGVKMLAGHTLFRVQRPPLRVEQQLQ